MSSIKFGKSSSKIGRGTPLVQAFFARRSAFSLPVIPLWDGIQIRLMLLYCFLAFSNLSLISNIQYLIFLDFVSKYCDTAVRTLNKSMHIAALEMFNFTIILIVSMMESAFV